MMLSLFLTYRTDSSWKQMFCLSFIVRSAFQSGLKVDLGSSSSVCSSAHSPGCLWPCPSWAVLRAAAKALAKLPLSSTQACPLAAASASGWELPEGSALTMTEGLHGFEPWASMSQPTNTLQLQVSVWGMLWPAGSQPGKQDVQGAGQGTTEIFVLLSFPAFFFFLLFESVSTVVRAGPQGWWQMLSASQTFTFFSFTLLMRVIWYLGWAMSKLWGFSAFSMSNCCGLEQFLFPLWEAGEGLVLFHSPVLL